MPPTLFTPAELTNLRNMANSGKRAEAYLFIANRYTQQLGAGAVLSIQQLYMQAEITTYSGTTGGAALLGNFYAKNRNPVAYNLPLDTFSRDILLGLINGIERVIPTTGGYLNDMEMHYLDYRVWRDKGMADYFPGNRQRYGDSTRGWTGLVGSSLLASYGESLSGAEANIWTSLPAFTANVAFFADDLGKSPVDFGFNAFALGQYLHYGTPLAPVNGYTAIRQPNGFGGQTLKITNATGDIVFFDDNIDEVFRDVGLWGGAAKLGAVGTNRLLNPLVTGLGRIILSEDWNLTIDAMPYVSDRMKDYLGADFGPTGVRKVRGAPQGAYNGIDPTKVFSNDQGDADVDISPIDIDLLHRLMNDEFVARQARYQARGGTLGEILGSSLGQFIGGKNPLGAVVGRAVFSVLGARLGQAVGASAATTGADLMQNIRAAFSDATAIRTDLQNAFSGAVIGTASSFLAMELADSLGLDGLAGDVFGNVAGSMLQATINNVSHGANIFDGFSNVDEFLHGSDSFAGAYNLMGTALASYLGVKLGSLVVQPQTQAGVLLSSLGSAGGGWAFGTAAGGLGWGVPAGNAFAAALGGSNAAGWIGLNIIAPGVGVFVGFVLGALIGNLFGRKKPKTPTASAETVLQVPYAQYEIGATTSANGGNTDLVTSMATSARDILNGLLKVLGGNDDPHFVTNLTSPTQVYGHTGSQLYVKLNGVQTNVASADEAVDKGVLYAIPLTQVVGGDLYAKRAVAAPADNLIVLSGNLQTANDYAFYQLNRKPIDAMIAAGWNSLSAADQAFYTANAANMNKVFAKQDDPLTGAALTFYNANQAQADRIAVAMTTSEYAASWIVTLQRAAELNLDKWSPSDFYGGVRGFVDSFDPSTHSVAYEDITLGWNGTDLTITDVPNGVAALSEGFFSIMPTASADGRTVTVNSFLTSGAGYTGWSGSTGMSGNNFTSAAGAGTGQSIDDFGSADGSVGGDDIAIGSSYNDIMQGRTGWDWLDGGAGDDIIHGGQDADVVLGSAGNDLLYGDKGDDYVAGGAGNDTMYGGDGNDLITGKGGTDYSYGDLGDDVFLVNADGGTTYDYMDGGAGSDTISYEKFIDATVGVAVDLRTTSYYGDGWTSIENLTGGDAADTLNGDSGVNVLTGRGGDDSLTGNDGDDVLEGGSGADQLVGGLGIDTASYEHAASRVEIELSAAIAVGLDAQGDTFSGIENLRGSRFGDLLKGSDGNNQISGLTGDDLVTATVGYDTYDGGLGFDYVDYSGATAGVTVNLGSSLTTAPANGYGSMSVGGLSGSQTLIGFEGVVGSTYGDNLSGGAGAQTFFGGAGNDVLAGGADADTYMFGRGDGFDQINEDTNGWNTLTFGDNILFQDLVIGTAGGASGFLDFYIRGTADQVRVNGNWADANQPKLKSVTLGGVAKIDLDAALNAPTATDGGDTMVGADTYGDLLFALNGDDLMKTRASGLDATSHVFVGGLGNDTQNGGSGDDTYAFDRDTSLPAGAYQQDYIVEGGGEDTLVFGPSVGASDVIYQVVGSSLYVGVRDATNPALTASQVSNRVLIQDGALRYYNVDQDRYRFSAKVVDFVVAGGATIDLRKLDLPWNTIVEYGPNHYLPIVLDLDGDGLDLTSYDESRVVARTASGAVSRLGWVGPTDGFLAYDRDGDGAINRLSEISFTQDKVGAKSDLEGLAAWDTNADGVLDAKDEGWGKLLVWTDRNQNGRSTPGELRTLEKAGVTSINLKGTATGVDPLNQEESYVLNELSFTRSDGSRGGAYDVALARRLLNAEGLYSGDLPKGLGDLDADGEIGRVLNDYRADALAQLGRTYDPNAAIDRRGVTYEQALAAAKLDFADDGQIDPVTAKIWAHRLDPAARGEFQRRQAKGSDVSALARIAATAASADRPGLAKGKGGSAGLPAVDSPQEAQVAPPAQAMAVEPAAPAEEAFRPELSIAGAAPAVWQDTAALPLYPAAQQGGSATGGGDAGWWRMGEPQTLGGGDTRRALWDAPVALDGPAIGGDAKAPPENGSIDPLRQQLLLRQAMAGFHQDGGGAAVWLRSDDVSSGLQIAAETRTGRRSFHPLAA